MSSEFRVTDMMSPDDDKNDHRQRQGIDFGQSNLNINMPNNVKQGRAAAGSDAELSIRDYWDIIIKYRRIFFVVVALVFSVTVSLYYLMPKKYSASLKILKKGKKAAAGPMAFMMGNETERFSNETVMLMAGSDKVVQKTLELLPENLKNIIPEISNEALEKRLMKVDAPFVKRNVSITNNNLETFVVNTVINNDPLLPPALVNANAEALLTIIREFNHKESNQKIKTITNLIDEQQKEIDEIDGSIRELHFSQKDKMISLTADEKKYLQDISLSERKLQESVLRQKELTKIINSIREEFGIVGMDLDKVKWINMNSALQNRLQELKFKREELSLRYKPINPSIRRLDDQIKSLEATLQPSEGEGIKYIKVDTFRTTMVSDLLRYDAELKAVTDRIIYLEQEIKKLNQSLVEMPATVRERNKLQINKNIKTELLGSLHASLQQERVVLMSEDIDFNILERAVPPTGPSSLSLSRYMVIGLFVGMFIAVCLSFVLNSWENTLRSSSDLKRNFGYPALGVIPGWNENDKYIEESEPDSNIAEVYSVLRNHIRFSDIESPEKCLVVASASQGEGKSLTSVNLCLSFILEGNRVLLISGDLRRSFSYTKFLKNEDLERKDGVVEYLKGECELKDCIYNSSVKGFDIIPTCRKATNPTRYLKDKKFKEMLEYGQQNYDVVIVDTPAVLPVVDTSLIAPYAKGVLVVAQAGSTPVDAIQEAINRMQHVRSPIIGMVLNKVKDLKLEFFYGYGAKAYTHYVS